MRTPKSLLLVLVLSTSLSGPATAQETAPAQSDPVIESYVSQYGVSEAEARRRQALLPEIGRVERELASRFPNQFAGLYVKHGSEMRVVVKMTGQAEGILRQVTTDPMFVTERAERPVQMMRALRDRATELLDKNKIPYDSDVDIWEEDIKIDVVDYDGAEKLLRTLLTANPHLKLRKARTLFQNTATIYGGRQGTGTTQYCTTGFTVTNGTRSGVLTAGHCDNSMTVAGSTLSLGSEAYYSHTSKGYDAQWMVNNNNTYPNEIYTSSTGRMVITQVYDPVNMPLDWEVCAYGYNMTTARCGKLKSKYQKTTDNNSISGYFFRVAPNTSGVMVQGGDSGGPVYGSSVAYGIIKGHGGSTYPNDMYFMSIADINVLGVQVKTTP